MIIAVKAIGIFIACMGFTVILRPSVMKKMIVFWKEGKRLYLGATIRVLFGVIFLLAASSARYPVVMTLLGILALIGGAIIFVLGPEKLKKVLDWWSKKPNYAMRIAATLVIFFGALILYSA